MIKRIVVLIICLAVLLSFAYAVTAKPGKPGNPCPPRNPHCQPTATPTRLPTKLPGTSVPRPTLSNIKCVTAPCPYWSLNR